MLRGEQQVQQALIWRTIDCRVTELQQQEQQRIKKRTEQMMASIVGRKASQTLRLTFEALK